MRKALLTSVALVALSACSTTKLLPEGEYLLQRNRIEISGDRKLQASQLTPYIRQQAGDNLLFGWDPMLSVYNWSNGSGEGINAFWEKIGTPPVVFDASQMQSSCDNLKTHMAYLGYYDAEVTSSVKTKKRKVEVTYHIATGERKRIDSLVFDLPEDGVFAEEFMADSANISIAVGDFLGEGILEAETVRGAEHFRNLGYYNFNKNHYFFEADTLGDKNILYYRVRPYSRTEVPSDDAKLEKFRFGKVTVSYPSDMPFNEKLLTQYNIIRPGAPYSDRVVNATYNRYSALRLFNQVNVGLTPSGSNTVDCDISLSGTEVFGFKANVELSSNSSGLLGASPQLTFFHRNLFGGGEWLNLALSGDWQLMPGTDVRSSEMGVSATLSLPQALGYPTRKIRGSNIPRTDFNISYNYQSRPEYSRNLASFSFGYSGQAWGGRLFYQLYPLNVGLVKLNQVSEAFSNTLFENPYLQDSFNDKIDLGLASTLYFTTDADIVPKTSYAFVRLGLDFSGNVLSLFNRFMTYDNTAKSHMLLGLPYSQYAKLSLDMGKVFRFGHNDSQALAFRLSSGIGYAYGNSVALPFEKQFYCGGANSMRGWQARTLGPGFNSDPGYFIIPSQTGDIKLEFDVEYRFPLVWKLEGALFAEAGNIWYLEDFFHQFPASLAVDWGPGLRLNLDFILLRIDCGFKLRDPVRDAGNRWIGPREWFNKGGYAVHFGVGYPF